MVVAIARMQRLLRTQRTLMHPHRLSILSDRIQPSKQRIPAITREVSLQSQLHHVVTTSLMTMICTLLAETSHHTLALHATPRPLGMRLLQQTVQLVATGAADEHLLVADAVFLPAAAHVLSAHSLQHPRLHGLLALQVHDLRIVRVVGVVGERGVAAGHEREQRHVVVGGDEKGVGESGGGEGHERRDWRGCCERGRRNDLQTAETVERVGEASRGSGKEKTQPLSSPSRSQSLKKRPLRGYRVLWGVGMTEISGDSADDWTMSSVTMQSFPFTQRKREEGSQDTEKGTQGRGRVSIGEWS